MWENWRTVWLWRVFVLESYSVIMRSSIRVRMLIKRRMRRIIFYTYTRVWRDVALHFVVVLCVVFRRKHCKRVNNLTVRRRHWGLSWPIRWQDARIDVACVHVVIDELGCRIVTVEVIGPGDTVTSRFLDVVMWPPILIWWLRFLVVHIILWLYVINFIHWTYIYTNYIY